MEPVPGFVEETGYKTANLNILARCAVPRKLDFQELLPVVYHDRFLVSLPWQDVEQAETNIEFFTMPNQRASYWIEEQGRFVWAILPQAGRGRGVTAVPAHFSCHTMRLTQIQDGTGRHVRPNGTWVPTPCSGCSFNGFEPKKAIYTIFEGRTVYLAATFKHPHVDEPAKMLQVVTLPATLLVTLPATLLESLRG